MTRANSRSLCHVETGVVAWWWSRQKGDQKLDSAVGEGQLPEVGVSAILVLGLDHRDQGLPA
jgi:hypothetical protein